MHFLRLIYLNLKDSKVRHLSRQFGGEDSILILGPYYSLVELITIYLILDFIIHL
jgi:hypothetical protein